MISLSLWLFNPWYLSSLNIPQSLYSLLSVQGVFDVDMAREEGCRGDDVRMLPTQQPHVATQPHTEHSQLIEYHDLRRVDLAGVHNLQALQHNAWD